MRVRAGLLFCVTPILFCSPPCLFVPLAGAPAAQHVDPPVDHPPETRLPNGKLQRDEILRLDFEKSLDDARELARLAGELKSDLERSDRFVLSIPALKKTEEIEKLARRIHNRMKR